MFTVNKFIYHFFVTGEELKTKLKTLNIELSQLATSMGISKQNLNSKLKTSDIGIGFLQDISNSVNKTIYQLIGDGQNGGNFEKRGYPLVSVEAVGGFGNSKFEIKEKDIQSYYLLPDFNDIDFMLRVKGNSMIPKYYAGDIVACRILRSPSFIQWNKPYVIATREQGVLIKRLKKGETEKYYVAHSENKEYDPFEIPVDEITGIALVVGTVRLE